MDFDDDETRMARLLVSKKISEALWDRLWSEWQDRRQTIQQTLTTLEQHREIHIDNLGSALAIIANIGAMYYRN